MLLGYSTLDEIVESGTDLAILSAGSIEQHGPHLPVTTDWEIASALGMGLAEKTGGFYVPAFPVSTNRESMGRRGSAVGMSPKTFFDMIWDVCVCLKNQGFKRIGIIQAHGGIFIMTPVVRELNATFQPDLMVAKLDYDVIWSELTSAGILETDTELHSGEGETSLMLHLKPELVHMDKAVDWVPEGVERADLNYGTFLRYCPDGVWGEAKCATAEKGEKMLAYMIEGLSLRMERAFKLMDGKEKLGYSWF